MSELLTIVQEQSKMIVDLQKSVHDLTVLVMKGKVSDTWLDEEVAASMVNYSPRGFREKVKTAHKLCQSPWNIIDFRHSNGRNYQYSRKSIIEFQTKTSF